ncbi:MAG: hypothetical protein HQL48_09170 [Gammaproteobacteria bacterium]|nr:hypothetical protein [Gammaproteobacteria bacterium]
MNKALIYTGTLIVALAVMTGCAGEKKKETGYSRLGTAKDIEVTHNGKVVAELHRVLDAVIVEGKGKFQNENEVMARNMALNIALNDLAKSAGEVLVEEDTTLYNDQVKMVLRTRARNIVQGYTITVDIYDPYTKTAEVVVRQEGERIASEIAREIKQPMLELP